MKTNETRTTERQLKAAQRALRTLVGMYIANRGSAGEFISCITPPHRTDAKRGDRHWKAWDAAIAAMGESP